MFEITDKLDFYKKLNDYLNRHYPNHNKWQLLIEESIDTYVIDEVLDKELTLELMQYNVPSNADENELIIIYGAIYILLYNKVVYFAVHNMDNNFSNDIAKAIYTLDNYASSVFRVVL